MIPLNKEKEVLTNKALRSLHPRIMGNDER